MEPPATVALLGLGLMGGSLAKALHAQAAGGRIIAWTQDGRDPVEALRAGIVDDVATEAAAAVSVADLIVLATPVGAAIDLLRTIAPAMRDDAVMTDVCSVKAPLVRAAHAAGIAERFVGSHPMCGSEHQGWSAADASLYREARIHIVPADSARTERVEALWRSVGGEPRRIDAVAHDMLMARVSHLPQLLASVLGAALGGAGIARADMGPGGRDMTRLAASPVPLWVDILRHNRPAVLDALTVVRSELDAAAVALAGDDAAMLEMLLRRGREWAQRHE